MEGEAAEVRFAFVRNQTVKVDAETTDLIYTKKKQTSFLRHKC